VTVGERWQDYIEEKKAEGKSVTRMVDGWKSLRATFADEPEVTQRLVRLYVDGRRRSGINDGTIHTELGYLRAATKAKINLAPPTNNLKDLAGKSTVVR
jgi:hypothetical protein